MDHRTEAACLLETGALYRRRIALETATGHGEPIFAGFKRGAFSLYFGDEPIYHFDLEGRWQRAFVEGVHYLKGLDGDIHAVDRVREGPNLVLRRRKLHPVEAIDLDARIRAVALDMMAGLRDGRFRRSEPPPDKAQPLSNDEVRVFLESINKWDCSAWLAHSARYRETYGPLPFLPPECQNAVVLQATLGHAGGRTFGLSAASDHRVRSTSEFACHVHDVSELWGRRLQQSRTIFLAGGDTLHHPIEQIEAYLDAMGRTFPIRRPDEGEDQCFGVHAFVDDFRDFRVGREGWIRLAERGLIRVSLGVESGDRKVRAIYGKTWEDADVRETVADIKSAGLGVSVLTLVGAGGIELAAAHFEHTTRLFESLELAQGDFVFLLDENEVRDSTVTPTGLTLLSRADWSEEQRRFKEVLAPLKGRGIKVLPYTLEKQWT
jgi:hypothetical protein